MAPHGAKETRLTDGDEITVGETVMKISVIAGALCPKCGASMENRGPSRGGKRDELVCPACRSSIGTSLRPSANSVHCFNCGKDVTHEAGAHAQIPRARYVCRACRKSADMNPMSLLDAVLEDAVGGTATSEKSGIRGYRFEGELGRGATSIVYKAVREKTGEIVAVKTMLPQVPTADHNIRSFFSELEVTKSLKHENIVHLVEYGKAEPTLFFVLEFVDGPDLGSLLKRKGEPFDIEEAVPIIVGTLRGLAHAHRSEIPDDFHDGGNWSKRGIVHRDLKPENILLKIDEKGCIPKVADFGLARSFEFAGLADITMPGQAAGNPVYWPREQITHYRLLNPATDVFSIAAVFYEALTGSLVRDGYSELFQQCELSGRLPGIADFMSVLISNPVVPIRQRRKSIPAEVADVIDCALRETEGPPDETRMLLTLKKMRFEDAGAFLEELEKAFQKVGISA